MKVERLIFGFVGRGKLFQNSENDVESYVTCSKRKEKNDVDSI